MTRQTELATAYDLARPRLTRVAYAMLGSWAEAEDVVSDCWLKLAAADEVEQVRDIEAWATVAVARTALDVLRSARARREVYPGPWLPEPVIDLSPVPDDPLDRVTLDDTVRYALLVVLETLTPAERTAWVLHDLFGMTFADVAETVGRTPAAVRQLAARARTHLEERTPRVTVTELDYSNAVRRFLDAAVGGDMETFLQALDPDVTIVSDGGGVVWAARRPIHGADKAIRFLVGIAASATPDTALRVVTINGEPGLGIFEADRLVTAGILTVANERIVRIDFVRAPDKLRHVVGQ